LNFVLVGSRSLIEVTQAQPVHRSGTG
jgi:hypothetical protein